MRILQYMSHMRTELGGPIRAVLDLTAALARRGHEVTLACEVDPAVPQQWKNDTSGWPRAVNLPEAAARFGGGKAGRAKALHGLIDSADLVHMHEVWDLGNAAIGRYCRRTRKPYFISVRGNLDDWCMDQKALKKRVYLALLGRRHLEGAAAVHTTAQFELEQARKHFPRGRGVVVPNLLDLAQFDTLPGEQDARDKFAAFKAGQPVVLFLSRIHVKKGIEHLLRAAAVLRDRGKAIQFVIAGTGQADYLGTMKAMAAELDLNDRVHFVGEVLGKDKLSLYQAADLFVLPTSQENFGFVFAEALACETPVVTTKGVDIWPELEASGGAEICSTEPAELAGVIERLIADPQRLIGMGKAGRQWVYRDLHPERVLDLFESMYKHGVERRAS